MPHGRMEGLERLAIGFAKLKSPVEYESPDGEPVDLMLLALAAYAAYVINAGQFLLKLRAARLQQGVAA